MQPVDRLRTIRFVRSRLEREGYPRLQMLLIVALTAASGLLASYGLLRAGMTEMWLRYLAAFAIAYLDLAFLAIALVGLALLGVALLSTFWVVYSAPLFLAEVFVDGMLAVTLYRRLRGDGSRHWLETAARRTLIPFAAVAALTALAGWALASYAPGARSIGDVLLHLKGVR